LKVGKEEIAGLLTALKIYLSLDHAAVRREQIQRLNVLQEGLADLSGIKGELVGLERDGYPLLRITLDEKALSLNAFDLVNRLMEGDPGIAVGQEGARNGYITINPVNLKGDQPRQVVERVRALLGG
jgi:L-seryl-tRNA(Ser) seleniumtransferase